MLLKTNCNLSYQSKKLELRWMIWLSKRTLSVRARQAGMC